MKTNRTILTVVALLVAFSLNAQVAINTDGSSPDASTMLDIQSSSSGTSFSNLDIADMSTAAPVTAPKTGLIAYNTNTTTGPGFVMWNGTKWVTFEIEGINWKLLGNAGTSIATNYVGTSDYNSLLFKANDTERMRIQRDGIVSVNSNSGWAGTAFYVYADGTVFDDAMGANVSTTGYAIYAQQTGTGRGIMGYANGGGDAIWAYNNGTGTGIYGRAIEDTSFGVWANNDHASGTGLVASGNNQSATYLTNGTGISGSGGDGIFGKGKDWDGTGIMGTGNNGDSTFTLIGGSGGSFTGASGIYAKVDNNSTGTGVIGVGNNVNSAATTTTGSGGAFTGQQGVYGKGIDPTGGTGVIGLGNNGSGYTTLANGSGGAFRGASCGVYGTTNNSGNRMGGYFSSNGSGWAYVGAYWGGTSYKIAGAGTVSTIVKDLNEQDVIMYCPEAPEVLFQDYGIGQLSNGKTHITLDPVLAKNIYVNENHPMKVFITLEGDCKGVYVTNKSANGFDVIELQGGSASVPFSWQIVATRANEEFLKKDGSVEISDYSKRFPVAPPPIETKEFKSIGIKQKVLQQKTVEVKDADGEIKAREEIKDTEK